MNHLDPNTNPLEELRRRQLERAKEYVPDFKGLGAAPSEPLVMAAEPEKLTAGQATPVAANATQPELANEGKTVEPVAVSATKGAQTTPEKENRGTGPDALAKQIDELSAIEHEQRAEQAVPPEPFEPPAPTYPAFEDQLKQIRETYAQDYATKVTRGLEEIDELKKDMQSKQVLHETAQVRDLRRELKKLEAILVEAHNQVQDKARQVEQMREIVAKKD